MDTALAQQFASEWLDAWNAHDLELILSHFTEAVVFTSPLARQLVEAPTAPSAARRNSVRAGAKAFVATPIFTSTATSTSTSTSKASTSACVPSSSTIATTRVDWSTKYSRSTVLSSPRDTPRI